MMKKLIFIVALTVSCNCLSANAAEVKTGKIYGADEFKMYSTGSCSATDSKTGETVRELGNCYSLVAMGVNVIAENEAEPQKANFLFSPVAMEYDVAKYLKDLLHVFLEIERSEAMLVDIESGKLQFNDNREKLETKQLLEKTLKGAEKLSSILNIAGFHYLDIDIPLSSVSGIRSDSEVSVKPAKIKINSPEFYDGVDSLIVGSY